MSDKAKHTPGPWFVFDNIIHCVGGPADTETGTAGIAMCGMRLRSPEEQEANARLITASPDLLAACRQLLSERQFEAVGGGGSRYWSPCNSDGWRMLEAAIAKAEGTAK